MDNSFINQSKSKSDMKKSQKNISVVQTASGGFNLSMATRKKKKVQPKPVNLDDYAIISKEEIDKLKEENPEIREKKLAGIKKSKKTVKPDNPVPDLNIELLQEEKKNEEQEEAKKELKDEFVVVSDDEVEDAKEKLQEIENYHQLSEDEKVHHKKSESAEPEFTEKPVEVTEDVKRMIKIAKKKKIDRKWNEPRYIGLDKKYAIERNDDSAKMARIKDRLNEYFEALNKEKNNEDADVTNALLNLVRACDRYTALRYRKVPMMFGIALTGIGAFKFAKFCARWHEVRMLRKKAKQALDERRANKSIKRKGDHGGKYTYIVKRGESYTKDGDADLLMGGFALVRFLIENPLRIAYNIVAAPVWLVNEGIRMIVKSTGRKPQRHIRFAGVYWMRTYITRFAHYRTKGTSKDHHGQHWYDRFFTDYHTRDQDIIDRAKIDMDMINYDYGIEDNPDVWDSFKDYAKPETLEERREREKIASKRSKNSEQASFALEGFEDDARKNIAKIEAKRKLQEEEQKRRKEEQKRRKEEQKRREEEERKELEEKKVRWQGEGPGPVNEEEKVAFESTVNDEIDKQKKSFEEKKQEKLAAQKKKKADEEAKKKADEEAKKKEEEAKKKADEEAKKKEEEAKKKAAEEAKRKKEEDRKKAAEEAKKKEEEAKKKAEEEAKKKEEETKKKAEEEAKQREKENKERNEREKAERDKQQNVKVKAMTEGELKTALSKAESAFKKTNKVKLEQLNKLANADTASLAQYTKGTRRYSEVQRQILQLKKIRAKQAGIFDYVDDNIRLEDLNVNDYTDEVKLQYEKALRDRGLPFGKNHAANTFHRSKFVVFDKLAEDYVWKPGTEQIVKDAYNWLGRYYALHDKTRLESKAEKERLPLPSYHFMLEDAEQINKEYEMQPSGTNNCFACSGAELYRQYCRKNGINSGNVNQNSVLNFKPDFKKYRDYKSIIEELDPMTTPEFFEQSKQEVKDYLAGGRGRVGNVFELADFFIDKQKNVMLNKVNFNMPKFDRFWDAEEKEKRDVQLNNMKVVFLNKVNEALKAGCAISLLTNSPKHYRTIVGIEGQTVKFVDSLSRLHGTIHTMRVSDLIDYEQNTEIVWMTKLKPVAELQKEYKNLTHDEKTGFKNNDPSIRDITLVAQSHGVHVTKDQDDMDIIVDGVVESAYLPKNASITK